MVKSQKSDAAESNAGDDFHVLWTIRKVLELLNFESEGLKLITIEELSPMDVKKMPIDTDGDILLGVDLTEYYGGNDISTAKRVVVSQLKYSTRKPSLPWTAARICQGKKGISGSIIHRLGTLFKGLYTSADREPLQEKLQIKLVSNRPAAIKLLNTIATVQSLLTSDFTYASFIKELEADVAQDIDRLKKASKLNDKVFLDFLRVLDFSDCNSDSRSELKQNLVKAIGELGSEETRREYSQLKDLVSSKMTPEAKGKTSIVLTDLLYQFGMPDLPSIFPARSSFERQKRSIVREQLPEIVKEIMDSDNSITALHAGAGIGKSTIVQQLASEFPQGSAIVTFDCYGGGTYLDPEDKRHKHENAFMQLSNELALVAGSAFLITRQQNDDLYIKAFKKRLIEACELIQKVSSDAVVAIFIDAADNSVTAGAEYQQRCFVHDLLRINLPERCRLIVTARTERLGSLELPDDRVNNIQLKPFSNGETLLFLTQSGFSVSKEEAEQFRELTYATPRVMSYVLGLNGDTLKQKLKPLEPNGKSLVDIFKLQINMASVRSGNKKGITQLLTNIIALPRPVPLEYLVEITGLSKITIDDISAELWSGLVRQGDLFSFRDEDFETYLRGTYVAGNKQWNAIAQIFLARANVDDYASIHLASALTHADKKDELLDIVLNQRFLTFPEDPVKNKEVSVERTRQAMLHCTYADRLNLLKLQMIAAEAAKTNDLLESILLDNPELASSYGNLQTNQRIYFQKGNPGWFGRVHFRSAAIYARNHDSHGFAREHFQRAEEWMAYRNKLKGKALREFSITNRDIAYGAEAVLHLEGVDQCIKWLHNWSPKDKIFPAIYLLVETLLENTDSRQLSKWLKGLAFRCDIQILIISLFAKQGLVSPLTLDPILKSAPLLQRIKSRIKLSLASQLLYFCEYALGKGKSYEEVKPLLEVISVKIPDHAPRFYGQAEEFKEIDLLFRKSIIEAIYVKKKLTPEDFYPERLKQAITQNRSQNHRVSDDETVRFNSLYKHLISIYQIRAFFLIKRSTGTNRKKMLSDVLQALEKDWEFSHRHEHDLQMLYKCLSVRLLDIAFFASDEELITKIHNSFLIRNQDNIVLHQAIADRISHTKKFEAQVLSILEDAEKAITRATISGSEKVNYYKEAAIIASRISNQTGKHYFDRMVEASNEVDIEAHHQIRCITYIANGVYNEPEIAHDFARYIEYCSEMLSGWDHFPWESGFEGIAKLDMATAFAILCRWDHRNTRDSQSHLTQLLKLSLSHGYLNHIVAGSLLPLNQYYGSYQNDLLSLILKKFDDAGDHYLKTQFVKSVIRDIKLHASSEFAKEFLNAIKGKKYVNGILVDSFAEYITQLEEVSGFDTSSLSSSKEKIIKSRSEKRDNMRKSYAVSIRRIDVTNSTEIHALLTKLHKKTNGYVDENLVFELLEQKVTASQRIAYLDAVCNLPENAISSWTYEKVLENLLEKWSGYSDVKIWKQRMWPKDLKNRFSYFTNHDHFSSDSVSKLANLYGASMEDVATQVLSILPDHIGELSASVIYQLFQCTAHGLDKAERLELIRWTLARWSNKIKTESGDGEYQASSALPTDSSAVVAQVVRYHIGHPDKRIRWRIGHCLRRFVDLGNTDIIDKLIKLQNQRTCELFQHAHYPFYWISAKLYLWISIDRICKENPGPITKFKDDFLTSLFDNNPPHAQIRYFIKSACISLLEFQPNLFNAEEKNKVNMCLMAAKPKSKKAGSLRRPSRSSSSNFQFKFDELDTIAYWYVSLGRLFDLSGEQIALMAEKYIFTHWGFTGDPLRDNHVKDQDYYLRSNNHGSEPTVEDLQTYYEYHSMFCVANELIEQNKLVDLEDIYEDWDSWISSWGLCRPGFWLADLRDPVPLVKKFHDPQREINDWEWKVTLKDFHQSVGLVNAIDGTYLTIYESSSVYYYEDHESTFIASALVAPEYARSLLIAMQTSDHRYDCHVPFEAEKQEGWDEMEEPEEPEENDAFQMIGWIRNMADRDEGLDDRDEFYSDIHKDRIVIGSEFIKWGNVRVSDDQRYGYLETDPDIAVTHLEVWNDIPPKIRYNDHSSSGSRLRIKKRELLRFLKANNRSLILQCRITRRKKDESYDYNLNRDYTLIYLFNSNGTIETIAGNH